MPRRRPERVSPGVSRAHTRGVLGVPPAIFDAGSGHPAADSLLYPDRDGDGTDAPAFALEVGQDPPPLPLLDGLDVELG